MSHELRSATLPEERERKFEQTTARRSSNFDRSHNLMTKGGHYENARNQF